MVRFLGKMKVHFLTDVVRGVVVVVVVAVVVS